MRSLKDIFRPKRHYETREAESLAKAIETRDVERRKRIWRQIGIALLAFLPMIVVAYTIIVWTLNIIVGCR